MKHVISGELIYALFESFELKVFHNHSILLPQTLRVAFLKHELR